MARKLALIIGNSHYEDAHLAKLAAPDVDARSLAETLQAPGIGNFDEVIPLLNEGLATVRKAIARFFDLRHRDDLLVLYFSGHGVRDEQGHLYLAVRDTEHDLLAGTAIEASYVTARMDRSASKRLVLILDCCHSGAFGYGTKAASGAQVGTATAFEGTGRGRVVLTATDSTQYAWEGDRVIGEVQNSLFTHYLIQGLRSGAADRDEDGLITIDELYDYVYEQVLNETPKQTPGKWAFGQQGEIVIAQNTAITRAKLPPEIEEALRSTLPSVRLEAVQELGNIMNGHHLPRAQAAREALQRLSEDDSRRVAGAALSFLKSADQASTEAEEEAKLQRQREIAVLLAAAREALHRGNLEEVAGPLDQVLSFEPEHTDALRLKEAHERAVDERARLEEAERRIRDLRQRIGSLVARANAADRHEEAITLLEEALGLDPEHTEVRQLLEGRHRLRAEAEGAARQAREIAAAEEQIDRHLELGELDAAEQALQNLDAALSASDVFAPLQQRLALMKGTRRAQAAVLEARRQFDAGDRDGALASLGRFSPRHPLVDKSLVDLGREAERLERARAEEAARQKAQAERAAEEAARQKAEAERKAAEDAARRQAEAERRAADEAARQKAEAERKAAEEAARRKAAAERRAAEDAARQQAEAERKAAEEAARRKAEAERRAAEHAARQKAEAERKAAEDAARQKAEGERKAAEEAARLKAEAERKARDQQVAALLVDARAALGRMQFKEALDALAHASRLDPQAPGVRDLRETAEAGKAAADAVERRRQQIEAQLGEAARHLARANHTKALVIVEAVLRSDPRNAAALALQADVQRAVAAKEQAQREAEAERAAARAAEQAQREVDQMLARASKRLRWHDVSGARGLVDGALARMPQHPASLALLSQIDHMAEEPPVAATGFSVRPTLSVAVVWLRTKVSDTFTVVAGVVLASGIALMMLRPGAEPYTTPRQTETVGTTPKPVAPTPTAPAASAAPGSAATGKESGQQASGQQASGQPLPGQQPGSGSEPSTTPASPKAATPAPDKPPKTTPPDSTTPVASVRPGEVINAERRARLQLREGNAQAALRYIELGLSVDPKDPTLTALRDEANRAIREAENERKRAAAEKAAAAANTPVPTGVQPPSARTEPPSNRTEPPPTSPTVGTGRPSEPATTPAKPPSTTGTDKPAAPGNQPVAAANAAGIQRTLQLYATAWENRSIDALRAVWAMPQPMEKSLRGSFAATKSLDLELNCQTPVIHAGAQTTATVSCTEVQRVVLSGGERRTVSGSAVFTLRAEGQTWIIANVAKQMREQ